MKRKGIFLLCISLLLASMLVCGNGLVAESAPTGSDKKVNLNILAATMRLEAMVKAWEQMIKNFEDANKGVSVTLNMRGEWDLLPQQLTQARMAGEKVDFVRTTGGIIRATLAPAGAVMDITDTVAPFKDRFVEGTLDNYTVGGHLWGIPYGETTTAVIYYNKTMFDELGLSEPTTLDELVDAAKVITKKKGIRNPWIHQGALEGYWQMWFAESYGQTSGHKSVSNMESWLSGKRSFVDDETIAAFAKIRELFERGVLTQDSFDTDDTGMKAMFAQQKAAMFYGGTWEYAPTYEIVDGAFEIGVFLWPSLGEGMSPLACGAADDGFAVASNNHRENWDYIAKFLDHMTTDENAALTIDPIHPIIPVLKSVKQADMPCAKEMMSFMPDTVMFLDWLWPSAINNVLGRQIGGVAAGQITPKNAAKAMQDIYERQVKEEDYQYNWYDSFTQKQWDEVTPPR